MEKYAHMSREELLRELAGKDAAEKARRSLHEQYGEVMSTMNVALVQLETVPDADGKPYDFRYLAVNASFEEETGLKGADVLTKTIREAMPEVDDWWVDAYVKVALTGEPISFVSYGSQTNRTYEVHAVRLESGGLSVTFKNISEPRRTELALKESQAHYQAMVNGFDGMMYVCAQDYRIEYHNEALLRHVGHDARGELCYQALYGLDAVCPWCVNDRVFAGESVRWAIQSLKDQRWHEVSSIPVFNADGKVAKKQVMIADITERKQMEEALLQSKRELELANEQLEQKVRERTADLVAAIRAQESFSYSVSHDLRAPLRHMNSFSAMLVEDFGEALPQGARDYLDRICAASNKLGSLIEHLLELSRVTRTALKIETVDLSEAASAALGMLRDIDPHRSVELVVEEGIRVKGDGAFLGQLLGNLLGNAWKYTGKKPLASIRFGKMTSCGEEVYFVKDNGAGFDIRYQEKMFRPFERLHGSEFEGVGIGLATTRHIVERHGGRIRCEGKVDEGATFYFTLPGAPHRAPREPHAEPRCYSA